MNLASNPHHGAKPSKLRHVCSTLISVSESRIAAIRYHGPVSVYQRFLPDARNWLSKQWMDQEEAPCFECRDLGANNILGGASFLSLDLSDANLEVRLTK
jgi:hypothetical protein